MGVQIPDFESIHDGHRGLGECSLDVNLPKVLEYSYLVFWSPLFLSFIYFPILSTFLCCFITTPLPFCILLSSFPLFFFSPFLYPSPLQGFPWNLSITSTYKPERKRWKKTLSLLSLFSISCCSLSHLD